jgi:hypothetical protein
MAFEYGSDTLGIKNPFRVEGALRAVAGVLVALLGGYALLSVKGMVEAGDKGAGWLTLAVAVVLLVAGLSGIGRGLFQLMRFFVGRGVPSSLAKNLSKSETLTVEPGIAYSAQQLEQMLQGRKNLTFVEPEGWLARLLYTGLPKLLFMPFLYRNLAQRLASALIRTVVAFFCLGLAWFSGTTGLTTINDTPVMDWLGLLLLVYLLSVWWQQRKPFNRQLQTTAQSESTMKLVLMITAAVLLPFLLAAIHAQLPLPALPIDAGAYLGMLTLLALIACAPVAVLIRERIQLAQPVTEVAEFRDNWQESIHPQEIFINFENMVMANRRYKEVPNRVYRDFDANLVEEGSNDKGRFNGEMIQETQPLCRELDASPLFGTLRMAATALGQLLLVLSAFWLYAAVSDVAPLFDAPELDAQLLGNALESLIAVALVWLFGRILGNSAHLFWAELQFESLMVYFQCRGTYTESRLSTGTSVYDSTRSENVVVRSSMTFWVIGARLLSTTFAGSGTRNLEFPRHVLELRRADADLDAIIGELRSFTSQRATIASIDNQRDLEATSRIFQVNQQTRAAIPAQDNAPQLDQERIRQLQGGEPPADKT